MAHPPHTGEQAHPSTGTYLRVFGILFVVTVIEVGVFYVPAFKPVLTPVLLALSPDAQALKRRMLACFATQRATLRSFPVGATEMLRPAPDHDAGRPPHPGALFYEAFPWGMTGPRFRALAAGALEALGIGVGAAAR